MPPPQPHHQQPAPYFNTILNNPPASTTTASRPPPPHPSSAFTPAQRSAQARYKEWTSSSGSGHPSRSAESYEQRQERDKAACILDSSEMLMWFAAARNESIPQTRQYYQNIVLGLGNGRDVAWREEWEVPSLQERGAEMMGSPAQGAKGKEREKAKAKKRVGYA